MSDKQPGFGQQPADSPRARWATILLALVMLALAVLAGYEFWIFYSDPTGASSWLRRAFSWLENPDPVYLGIGGAIIALLGVWLVLTAFKRRQRRYRTVRSDASIWVRPVDIARYTTATAKRMAGVSGASTLVKRKKVVVTATVTQLDPELRDQLTQDLSELLSPLFGDSTRLRVVLTRDDSLFSVEGGANE